MSVDPSKLAAKSSSTALTQLAPLSASKLTLPLPQSESNGTKTRPKTSRSMSTTNVKAPSVAALPPLSVSSLPSPTMPRRTKSFLSVTENTGSEKAPAGSLLPSTPRSPRNCSASPKTPRKTLVKQTSAPRGISETENDNTTSQQNLQRDPI
ncbi:hypothetical protein BDR26DRAFT_630374 [Obelidium mucronatum]|nr:hypothetical protein BDR26DRAFT_630374 [Obelidium mucronatum]